MSKYQNNKAKMAEALSLRDQSLPKRNDDASGVPSVQNLQDFNALNNDSHAARKGIPINKYLRRLKRFNKVEK